MSGRFGVMVFLAGLSIGALAQSTEPLPDANGYYSLGNGVERPKIIHPSPAAIPRDPRVAKLKYSRVVSAKIDSNGKLVEAHIASPNPGPYDAPALAVVKRLEFEPAKLHGRPVPVAIQVWVPFVPGEKRAVPEIMPIRLREFNKDDRPPVLLFAPEPEYSKEARATRLEGIVLVSTLVTETGETEDVRVFRPLGKGLDEKAVEAVQRYKFHPALRWGIPIPAPVTIEVNFRLFDRAN